jgi:hypothetical protein
MPALQVPCYIQTENFWCQSTCLLMIVDFINSRTTAVPRPAIQRIFRELNAAPPPARRPGRPQRPSNQRNAWVNFAWWLNISSDYRWTFENRPRSPAAPFDAMIRRSIERGLPVLVGVSHERTPGHVILIVGYEDIQFELAGAAVQDVWFVCHDPFGDKDRPRYWGDERVRGKGEARITIRGRWAGEAGMLPTYSFPGQEGPGKGVLYSRLGVSRALNEQYENLPSAVDSKVAEASEVYTFRYIHATAKAGRDVPPI